jgi:hypothetical protein
MYQKMSLRKILSSIVFFLFSLLYISCSKDDSPGLYGKLQLEFLHEVDGQALELTDKVFVNAAGNAYRVEKLKYYVSNIELTGQDGQVITIPDGYYLIEQTSLDNRTIIELAEIPAARYSSLSFNIGVDSTRNFSTEMVGDLNPNNDMAWNWVSGYKFLMLEGKFTTNTQATGALVYHIGGNTSLRRVQLTAPAGGMQVNSTQTTELGIGVNINRIFNTQSVIDLNQTNAVMQPGIDADKIADNYAKGMFQLHHVHVK